MATKRLSISLPESLYDEIGESARREHRTRSEFAREALRRYVSASFGEDPDVEPWERDLVAERLEAYHRDPDSAVGWREVHTAAMEAIQKVRPGS